MIKQIDHSLLWGTSGRNGNDPVVFIPLKELTTNHLQNILLSCSWHIPQNYKDSINDILRLRKKKQLKNITYEDSLIMYNAYRVRGKYLK